MPFNGAGVFVRVHSWLNDRAASIKIRADRHDAEDDGFAAGLSNCITKDGQTIVTADIPLNGKKLTNIGDAASDGDAVNLRTISWRKLLDSTLSSAATEITIPLNSMKIARLRADIIIGTASNFELTWRVSYDGGTTYASDAGTYVNVLTPMRNTSSQPVYSVSNNAGYLTFFDLSGPSVSGSNPRSSVIIDADINAGSSSLYPEIISRTTYRGVGGATMTLNKGSHEGGIPPNSATHIKLISSAASGFGAGSRLIVEGR